MDEIPVVRIWRYLDAPHEFRELSIEKGISIHGGKEEWLIHVPTFLVGYIPWIEIPQGGATVSHHPLPNGSVVYIRARA